MKHFFTFTLLTILLTGCSTHSPLESFEDIYTNTTVIKPTSKNYSTSAQANTAPIIKEVIPSTSTVLEQKSVQVKLTGRIINTSFDDEVKLYVYTFLADDTQEHTIFYYDQKLTYPTSTLLDVNILDNYLITATKHLNKPSLSISEKKKYIKHKKRNTNIREAIEEKINTF